MLLLLHDYDTTKSKIWLVVKSELYSYQFNFPSLSLLVTESE